MPEKSIKSRIVHKHDSEANWLKATNFIPKQGEIIVYDADEKYPYERFKIGDGTTLVSDLPFSTSQSDWNQNDPTKTDYVKNRTHWKEFKEVSPLTTITPFYYESLGVPMGNMADFDIVIGNKYKVTFDGVDYVCEAFMATMAGVSAPAFGNTIVAGGADTGDPFAIFKLAEDNWTTIIFLDMNQHSVQVYEETFNKIPTAFLQTLEETRTKKVTLLPYQEAVYESSFDGYITPLNFSIELGATYEVNYNGTMYTCKAINGTYYGIPIIAVGNSAGTEGKEPFVMTDCAALGMPGYLGILVFDSPDSVNIGIEGYKYDKIAKEIIPTLEEMYCKETLIFSDTITLNADGEGFPISEGLTVGYTYTINWNGVDYSCKAIDSAILGEPGYVFLGNLGPIFESGDTGEPFVIVSGFDSDSSSFMVVVESLDGSTTVNLTIMHQDITKISKKLLPTIDEMFFEKNEKLVPTEFDFSQGSQQYIPYIELIPNDTYIVSWDGVEYTCTAEPVEDAFVIGNIGAISGESTGEPFLIISDIEDVIPLTTLIRVGGSTTVTVSITHAKINKVPKECLPDDLNLDVDVSGVLTEAKEYTDTKADTTLTEAKEYTDSKSEATLTEAKEYTDTAISSLGSLGSVTPNWEASEGEDGYILNRTHYVDGYEHNMLLVDTTKTSILASGPKITSTKDDVRYTAYGYYLVSGIDILVGETYRVVFDDIEYNIVATQGDHDSVPHKFINSPYYGNWVRGEYNANIPFAIDSYEKDGKIRTVIYIKDTNTHTFSIYGTREAVHKLDKKYLPDVMFAENPVCTGSFSMSRSSNTKVGAWSSTLGYDNEASAYCTHAEGFHTLAKGDYSHAEGSYTTASGKYSHAEGADIEISRTISGEANATTYIINDAITSCFIGCPINYNGAGAYITAIDTTDTFNKTITLDRTISDTALSDAKITIHIYPKATGDASHAEGFGVIAEGKASHAEGNITLASGENSHAEGNFTLAGGRNSHAEGNSVKAEGKNSHAEGNRTFASGEASHAEGTSSKATGYASHAEGFGNASGDYSHAEGTSSKAEGKASHAEGEDTTASSDNQHVQGKYNIKDTANKYAHIVGNGNYLKQSNAHTLDWDGNAWFAGDVYVGSTSGTNKDEGSVKLASEAYVDNALAIITIPELDAICVIPLEAGLYEDGSLITEWEELINDGILGVGYTPEDTSGELWRNESKSVSDLTGDLVISNDVLAISYGCFKDCIYLTGVTIPNTISSLNGETFSGCTSLVSVELPESTTSISGRTFLNCTSLSKINIPDGLNSISDGAFQGCSNLNIAIPNSVTSIGYFAFQSTGLETVDISASYIGGYAFAYCVNLKTVILEDGVTKIPESAFLGCTALTSVTISDSVTVINSDAFKNCSSLATITIPSGVTAIDADSFLGCTSLATITFNGTTSQWNNINGGGLSMMGKNYWASGVPATQVICSNGTITL